MNGILDGGRKAWNEFRGRAENKQRQGQRGFPAGMTTRIRNRLDAQFCADRIGDCRGVVLHGGLVFGLDHHAR